MCQSENFWHIVVGILRRISPFQRSAALGGPFFVRYLLSYLMCPFLRRLLNLFQATLAAFVTRRAWPLESRAYSDQSRDLRWMHCSGRRGLAVIIRLAAFLRKGIDHVNFGAFRLGFHAFRIKNSLVLEGWVILSENEPMKKAPLSSARTLFAFIPSWGGA